MADVLQVEQALHGYRRGHRLLRCSCRLEPDEERLLHVLSDLSGALSGSREPVPYETGYSCGRFFVVARTWLDEESERAGSVVTHSLLLPAHGVADVGTLRPLLEVLRRPGVDSGTWGGLSLKTVGGPAPILDPADRRALAATWFGQRRRPVLWRSGDPLGAVEQLWTWLAPWHRGAFSFCTWCLQPRRLGDELFAWMAPAQGADSAFRGLRADSMTWSGVTLPRELASIADGAAMASFSDSQGSARDRAWLELERRGLGELPATSLPRAFRYLELAARSEESLEAARSRIALLRVLHPEGPAGEREAALHAWLGRLAEVQDLGWTHAAEIARQPDVEATPDREPAEVVFERAVVGAVRRRERGLDALWASIGERWQQVVFSRLDSAARASTEEQAAWAAATADVPELWSRLVRRVDPEGGATVVLAAAEVVGGDRLREPLLKAARELRQPELLAAFFGAEEAPPIDAEVLELALELTVSGAPDERTGLRQLLRSADEGTLGEWLAGTARPGRALAALLECPKNVDVVVQAIAKNEGAASALSQHASPKAIGELVERRPEVGQAFVRAAFETPEEPLRWIAVAALEALGAEQSLAAAGGRSPAALAEAGWGTELVARLFPALWERWWAGGVEDELLDAWLATDTVRRELSSRRPWERIRRLRDASGPEALMAVRFLARPGARPLWGHYRLLHESFLSWRRAPTETLVAMVPHWLRLTALLPMGRDELRTASAAAACNLSIENGHPDLAALAEAGYAVSRGRLPRKRPSTGGLWPVVSFFAWMWGGPGSEDTGESPRRQLDGRLARVWVQRAWSPESLVRCAGGDEKLACKLVRRAADLPGAGEALTRLADHLRGSGARPQDLGLPGIDRLIEEVDRQLSRGRHVTRVSQRRG